MSKHIILGTAGHIDHGKTSLIAALTGTNTDRLPEEKKRGITIELGYAKLELNDQTIGIVDVPGHERFVRTMLAGATGIDLALLVVAADDSVMPQTREHLEILKLLDISHGVIALTKSDLAQPDWLSLVESEVRELVQGTFLESAAIIPTSTATNDGVELLRNELAKLANAVAIVRKKEKAYLPFRMAIDRTFSATGHGTIVTGSVLSGMARLGDKLEITPGGGPVRVRAIQNHDAPSDSISQGQRAAVNLAGVHHSEIRRGQELATPGYLQPSRLLTVRLQQLPSAKRPLKNHARVRLHLGTAEVLAKVNLLQAWPDDVASRTEAAKHEIKRTFESEPPALLSPGQTVLAQLTLEEEIVATWKQPFVLRCPSPVETIGGGMVLQPNAKKIRLRDVFSQTNAILLASSDEEECLVAALFFNGLKASSDLDLLRQTGLQNASQYMNALADKKILTRLRLANGHELLVAPRTVESLIEQIERRLKQLHNAHPLQRGFSAQAMKNGLRRVSRLADVWAAVIEQMLAAKRISRIGTQDAFALKDHGPKLSRGEQFLLDSIVATLEGAGVETPTPKKLAADAPKNKAAVPKLLELAATEGTLVQISDDYFVHKNTLTDIQERLQTAMPRFPATTDENSGVQNEPGLTLSEIRDLLGTTRKYAVPICEYLDSIGFTKRQGDQRYLCKTGPLALADEALPFADLPEADLECPPLEDLSSEG